MKKIVLILLFTSGSIFANTAKLDEDFITDTETADARTKCEIVRDNVYNYCVNHGYTTTQATEIAGAALKECNRVKSINIAE